MTMITLEEVEAFLVLEARILDERRWNDWLALFADDGWYWVPIEEGQSDPRHTVSLMYDDRQLLETRVRRLTAGSLHAQSPLSRTSRLVANATIEENSGDCYTVRSKFQMIEYRRNNQRLFGGTQWHGLSRTGNDFCIQWKKVELANCDSMMDGLSVPF
ncbi:MAG: aromatic-ring-hydroxylating dioxygenase subunit beta [Pseudomonadota bacterium]|nr:aromatic-ring-hydroxylating dioxygenase subunit beta [Pseudomonadota bacterium]